MTEQWLAMARGWVFYMAKRHEEIQHGNLMTRDRKRFWKGMLREFDVMTMTVAGWRWR